MSNFVPKPHTPYQWNGMQSREYFRWAGDYLHRRKRMKSVRVKQHDIDTIVVDLQDAGTRFYTYASTMKLATTAAATSWARRSSSRRSPATRAGDRSRACW